MVAVVVVAVSFIAVVAITFVFIVCFVLLRIYMQTLLECKNLISWVADVGAGALSAC